MSFVNAYIRLFFLFALYCNNIFNIVRILILIFFNYMNFKCVLIFCAFSFVKALYPKTTRDTKVVEQVFLFIAHCRGEPKPWEPWTCQRVMQRSYYRIWTSVRWFWVGFKEVRFSSRLDSVKKWKVILWLGNWKNINLEVGKVKCEAKTVIDKEAPVTYITHGDVWSCLYFDWFHMIMGL